MSRRALVAVFAAMAATAVAIGAAAVRQHSSHADMVSALARLTEISKQADVAQDAVRRLSTRWNDVSAAYDRATAEFRSARAVMEDAKARSRESAATFATASEQFEAATRRWRFYQALVVVAAQIDASHLDAFRRVGLTNGETATASCEHVSTAEMRRVLTAAGVSLVGKDIDHIVPRSLGGADHPSNYQILDASLNRSLGATWNRDKCEMAGPQCADAIAVSRTCGWYRGPVL
jgi:hypothetical protein